MVDHISTAMNFKGALDFWKNLKFEAVVIPRLEDTLDLHAILFENEDFVRGELKQSPNFVRIGGGQYLCFTAPKNVELEYEKLMTESQTLLAKLPPPEPPFECLLAKAIYVAYFHARFIHIHPFEDGNGRLSRFIAHSQIWKLYPTPLFDEQRLDKNHSSLTEFDRTYYLSALQRSPEQLSPLIRYFLPPNAERISDAIQPPFPIPRKIRPFPPEPGDDW